MPNLLVLRRRARVIARRRIGARRKRFAMRGKMANKPLVKLIRAVMKREEETKYVANSYDSALNALANTWNSAGTLAAATAWYPAIPKLNQGTGDYQRVGSKIQPVSCTVSMKVGFNPQDLSANSLYGVVYYGTSKAVRSWLAAQPIGNQQILDGGDGINYTFNGDRFRLNYPVDKKLYNLKRIVFRLSKTAGIQNSDQGGAGTQPGSFSTANGTQCRNITLKLRAPKKLLYEDNVDGWPSNFAPMFAVGFCHADGSPLTAADSTLVQVSSQAHMYFKDA